MIVYLVLAVAIGAIAVNVGVPSPLAVIAAIAGPGLLSWGWLKVGGKDAPTNSLRADSPRTGWFLRTLAERYRSLGALEFAGRTDEIAATYAAGDEARGNALLRGLTNTVAHHPAATELIDIWQTAWRDSGR